MSRQAALTFMDDPRAYQSDGLVAHISGAVSGKKELLDKLADGLGLPAHFGHNWDALEESLREFSWAKGARSIAIVHEELPVRLSEDDLRIYLEILAESVAELRKAKDSVPALQVVFPVTARKRIHQLLPQLGPLP